MPPPPDDDFGFVLLHGAMLGRWIWERVEPRLAAPALAVDFPGRGHRPADITAVTLEDVVDSVVADVEAWPTDHVVLVAHSLSGIVVPGVISRVPLRIAHVVSVSAAVPLQGASYLDSLPGSQRILLRFALLTQNNKGLLSPPWATKRALCNDLDQTTTELVIDKLTREAPRMYSSPVEGEIPASMPTTYVRLTADRGLSPAVQDKMITRLRDPRVEEIDAGHLPMLGHPDELADVLNVLLDGARDGR